MKQLHSLIPSSGWPPIFWPSQSALNYISHGGSESIPLPISILSHTDKQDATLE